MRRIPSSMWRSSPFPWSCTGRLGLSNLEVKVNSVGCPECRPTYRKTRLRSFLEPRLDELCDNLPQSVRQDSSFVFLIAKNPQCAAIAGPGPSGGGGASAGSAAPISGFCSGGLEGIGASFSPGQAPGAGAGLTNTKTAYEVLSVGICGARKRRVRRRAITIISPRS